MRFKIRKRHKPSLLVIDKFGHFQSNGEALQPEGEIMKIQEVRLEVTVRFDPNNRDGLGEFFISDCRAEAITQVESLTAVIAYGARDVAHQSINQYLKHHNPAF